MSIRVNLPGIESQADSVRTMCQDYMDAMENVKMELQAFILDVSLQGKTYSSAKTYFSEVYIPLADGIILLCERLMLAHEQFPKQYRENVDTNSLASEILEQQINQLDIIIQTFEAQAATTSMMQGLFQQQIMIYKHIQEKVATKLARLVEFDTTSATIFIDIQELLVDVNTGLERVTNRKAWNEKTETFHMKGWDVSWASRIKHKKDMETTTGKNNSIEDKEELDAEEEQIRAYLDKGDFDGEYNPDDYEFPEDEPIGFWDKSEVVGGNSPIAGTPDGFVGPAAFALNVGKGIVDGLGNALDDTVDGIVTTVAHPIETTSSLWSAVRHPVNTYGIMKEAISTSFDKDVKNGDAESRARWFSYAGGTIITSVVGTKGVGTVTKTGTTTAKTIVQQTNNKMNSLNFNNKDLFGRELALTTENSYVPYNVYDGEALKDQILLFANKFKDGQNKTGLYNSNTMEHIFLGEVNKRNKVVGYHHESMMGGNIVPGTKTLPDKNGVYEAGVIIKGKKKTVSSSFFPEHWDRVDVLKAVGEAYENRKSINAKNRLYSGYTFSGIRIEMYLNKDGTIATAYPKYDE